MKQKLKVARGKKHIFVKIIQHMITYVVLLVCNMKKLRWKETIRKCSQRGNFGRTVLSFFFRSDRSLHKPYCISPPHSTLESLVTSSTWFIDRTRKSCALTTDTLSTARDLSVSYLDSTRKREREGACLRRKFQQENFNYEKVLLFASDVDKSIGCHV